MAGYYRGGEIAGNQAEVNRIRKALYVLLRKVHELDAEVAHPHPQPRVYPACSTCATPYVLRRAFTFATNGGCPRDFEWVYQRDCKHRTVAAAVMVDARKRTTKRKPTIRKAE